MIIKQRPSPVFSRATRLSWHGKTRGRFYCLRNKTGTVSAF